MKIMAFGDIHEYLHTLSHFSVALRRADLILISGDMTRWRGPETASKVLEAIKQHQSGPLTIVSPEGVVGSTEGGAATTRSPTQNGITIWVHVSATPKDPSAQPLMRIALPAAYSPGIRSTPLV